MSVFIQWTTSFVAGVIIGFIYEWRLTLVMLGATPFMVASAAFIVRVSYPAYLHAVILYQEIMCNFHLIIRLWQSSVVKD